MRIPAAEAAVDKVGQAQEFTGSEFRNIDGFVPPEALRVGRALAKVQGTSRASRRQSQRRHKMPSSLR